MAVWSSVSRSELEATHRIDAEYYQKVFTEQVDKLLSVPYTTLGRAGNFVSGPFGSEFIVRNYVESSYRYVRGRDVKPFFLTDEDNVYIPEKDFSRLSKHSLLVDDLLISVVGTLGNVAIVGEDITPAIFSCKSTAFRATTIEPFFLLAYLNSPTGQSVLMRQTRGTVQTGLVIGDLRVLPVFKPSRPVQELIGGVVRQAQQNLGLAKQYYLDAENELLTALNLNDWHPPKINTWMQLSSQVAIASRWDGEYYHPRYSMMIKRVPSTVSLVPLRSLVDLLKGIEVGGKEYRTEGAPFWRVANLSPTGLRAGNLVYVSNDTYNLWRGFHEPQPGEILLSKDGSPGLALFLEHPIRGLVSGGILRLLRKAAIDPYYLELVLNSTWVQQQVEQSAGGSVIKHWKPAEVRATLIPRLTQSEELRIGSLARQSHELRRQGESLLEKAKSAVEIAIHQSEATAVDFLQ